jgi:curved DNA-binding protein
MKYKDYYASLGVARDADLEQIKTAYRKLARQHHPDVSKAPDAEARFKDAAEAYATLKNPEKRAAYDALGKHPQGEAFTPPPQWSQDAGSGGHSFEDMDLADLLAAMGRAPHGGRQGPQHGRDFETGVRISVEQAHRGTTLKLDVAGQDGDRTLEVTLPPGVSDGQKLRLKGRGGKGLNGGADGDIYLHITLDPHPVFRTDKHDLYFDLALTPWEAALGAEVQVPTLDGPVLLTVPPGTRSARKLRLRERGLTHRQGGRGDLYAIVHIDVPTKLSTRENELFSALASESSFNPRESVTKGEPHEFATV